MKKILGWLSAVSFLVAILIAGLFIYGVKSFDSRGGLEQDKIILIKKGSSLKLISNQLVNEGIIKYKYLFEAGVRINASAAKLQAGEYLFPQFVSMRKVMETLEKGDSIQHKITIPEGLYTTQILSIINADKILKGEITDIPFEGTLLPDTYNFSRGDSKQDIINRMKKAQEIVLNKAWDSKQANLPIKTKKEALILASIIEKETGIGMERKKVSGVFINRLNKGMLLQTDPTVIYAVTLGKYVLNRGIRRSELKSKSPYNTYVHVGLPPTPITNPGKLSIEAALNPEKHDYIFFVADGTGGHAFGKTLREHNNNVAKWRKIERNLKKISNSK